MDWSAFRGKKVCVAISGGVDSVVLLHTLFKLREQFKISLSAVHCEHGIRGEESLADGEFVKAFCASLGVPCYYFSEDCPARAAREKVSLETAARNFRYACFSALVEKEEADFIATAHHLNDEAETVLFRLARGSALSGVRGMDEKNGYILRPFLHKTRAEIERYAKENGLAFREDKTNFETDATRNRLRWNVLPVLENAVPGASGNIARFARLAAEDDALLYAYAKELLFTQKEGKRVGIAVGFSDKKPLFTRACLLALKGLGVEKDYTSAHLESVYFLQDLERGARVSLPQNVCAEKLEKGVLFYKKPTEEMVAAVSEKIFDENGFDGGRYEVKCSFAAAETEERAWKTLRLDREKLPKDCVFRFRREGDFIERFGGGKKSLKKFFNEEKIPVDLRGELPLIAQKDGGEVYAVCGVEISEKVKVTAESSRVIYLITKEITKEVEGL